MAQGADTELNAFLARAFPGISLRPGGYENWPHLRFELGDEIPVTRPRERAAQAAGRATAVFEAAFAPHDEGFLTFTRWRADDHEVFTDLLPRDEAEKLEERVGNDFYAQGEADSPYVAYTAALRLRAFAYGELFRLVANCELGESPSLGGRAYLVNQTQPLVFHMYDDRGAIVVAQRETELERLHESFDRWLAHD